MGAFGGIPVQAPTPSPATPAGATAASTGGTFGGTPVSDEEHAQNWLAAAENMGQHFYQHTVLPIMDLAKSAASAEPTVMRALGGQLTPEDVQNVQAVLQNTAKAVKQSYHTHMGIINQGASEISNGDIFGGARRVAMGMIPVFGPGASKASDSLKNGDWVGAAGNIGDMLGDAASLVGPEAIKALGPAAEGLLKGAAGSDIAKIPEQALMRSALNLPKSVSPTDAAKLTNTAISNGIGVSDAGAAKMAGQIQDLAENAKQMLVSRPSTPVPPERIAAGLDPLIARAKQQMVPGPDVATLKQMKQDFLAEHTGTVRPPIDQTINNRNLVYHATNEPGFRGILESGNITPEGGMLTGGGSEGPPGVSVSRIPAPATMAGRPVSFEIDNTRMPPSQPIAEAQFAKTSEGGMNPENEAEQRTSGQPIPLSAVRSVLVDKGALRNTATLEGRITGANPTDAELDSAVENRANAIAQQAAQQGLPVKMFDSADDISAYRAKLGQGTTQSIPIPIPELNAMKQGTYRTLGNRAYGELKSAQIEGEKGLAHQAMEEVEAQVPEVKGTNKQLGSLLDLRPYLEKAISGMGNKTWTSLGDMVAAGVGGAAHGPLGAAGAVVMRHIMGSPAIKSKLALMINAARSSAGLPIDTATTAARINRYVDSLDQVLSAGKATAPGAATALPMAASGNQQQAPATAQPPQQ